MTFKPFLTDKEIKLLQEQEAHSNKIQKRTPEQIEAIYTSGQNILVSASAGSGKTFVMVERIIDKVMRGVSIDSLFISTFTVKAATELKERLEKKLIEAIKTSDDYEIKAFLNNQLQSLYLADIGTMDAFTQKLISEYGYTIGIAPKYRIMQDKSEQDVLKDIVYKGLFEEYAASDKAEVFFKLVKNFSGNRKDTSGFKDVVNKVYTFSQSTENPKLWLEENFLKAALTYQDYATLPDQMVTDFLEVLTQTAHNLRGVTEMDGYPQLKKDGKPTAKYTGHLRIIDFLETCASDFYNSYGKEKLSQLAFEVSELLPSGDGIVVNKKTYPIYKQIQTSLKSLRHLDTIFHYQAESIPLLMLLKDFVIAFSKSYLERKKIENAYEFSDIAHFAITILENNLDIRQIYQNKYHEVMVDEYQDNNHMQERLLELLSNGQNRFMVGDIKQSIYRFRQADPQIFNSKFKDYQEHLNAGKLILLKENFRSQSDVLDVTNAVFSHLMDEEIGDILYDKNHQLLAGSSRQKELHLANQAQVLIYDTDDTNQEMESENEVDGISSGEVKIVAKEIIRLHQEEDVAFSEITLLVSSRTRNDSIFQTFSQYGIPLVADGGQENYLKSVEVMVMLETLRSINNPYNDYALVALLRSPMFNFDEDQLARIAMQKGDTEKLDSFYDKLKHAQSGQGQHRQLITSELGEKISQFLEILKNWRVYSQKQSLYSLIWKIYNDRFYFDFVGTLPKAEQAQANLYALALRAQQFEKTGFKGLTRFIGMIDKILTNQNDLADVDVAKPKEAVSIMTIHKSKGLEFKYVFILNCDKKFALTDLHSSMILSRKEGAGIKYLADVKDQLQADKLNSLKVYLETLPYQLNRTELKYATLSEQMRLFYVAMTRAEKKLYMIGKGSKAKLVDKFDGQREGNHLPKALRERMQSFQEWLLAIQAAFPQKELHFTLDYINDEQLSDQEIGQLEMKQVLFSDDIKDNRQTNEIARAIDMLDKVQILNQTYQAAINLPTVRTPSQIKKFYEPVMPIDGIDVMTKAKVRKNSISLPDFSKNKALLASDIGSAMHELMQRIPISEAVSLMAIETTKEELIAVDEKVKESLDIKKIYDFFHHTELGRLILKERDHLYREAPFAMLKKDSLSQEKFVVRGIIDGFLRFDDRIILFDYKTDKYHNSLDLANRYHSQMELYAEALREAYGVEKVDKYLILLGGKNVEVIAL
ncbi:helicase-exonuclease AddAB subunit AddA [Streptococcus hongkongensis]